MLDFRSERDGDRHPRRCDCYLQEGNLTDRMPLSRAAQKDNLKSKTHCTQERKYVASVDAGPISKSTLACWHRQQEQSHKGACYARHSPMVHIAPPKDREEQRNKYNRNPCNEC